MFISNTDTSWAVTHYTPEKATASYLKSIQGSVYSPPHTHNLRIPVSCQTGQPIKLLLRGLIRVTSSRKTYVAQVY